MCIKYEYLQCALLYSHIHTRGMLKAWPIHTKRTDPKGQLTRHLCMCLIYTVFCAPGLLSAIITFLFFYWKAPYSPLCYLWLAIGKSLNSTPMYTYITFSYSGIPSSYYYGSATQQWPHTMLAHGCSTQSVGLAQTYFTHSSYLVVQSWICTTYSFPDIVNQTGPYPYHYVKSFLMGGLHVCGAPCDHNSSLWCCVTLHSYH